MLYENSNVSNEYIYNINNQLTYLCLPDGSHICESDSQFFLIQNYSKILFGISTYRQLQINQDLKEQLYKSMSSLEDREKNVLIARFGLEDNNPKTLDEIGAEMHLSRERIRQIEEKALRKLRNPIRSENLKPYIIDAI